MLALALLTYLVELSMIRDQNLDLLKPSCRTAPRPGEAADAAALHRQSAGGERRAGLDRRTGHGTPLDNIERRAEQRRSGRERRKRPPAAAQKIVVGPF